jgi:hypothetical protein
MLTSYGRDGISSPALASGLKTSFPMAKEAKWSQSGAFFKAQFSLDGKEQTAFFTERGEWIATARNISSAELPKELKASLKEALQHSWITDLIVMTTDEGTSYYVQLENADTKTIRQSVNDKKWKSYTAL